MFSLVIEFDALGLTTLSKNQQNVLLVQNFQQTPPLPIAWAAVPPMQKLYLSWGGTLFVYSSTTAPLLNKRVRIGSSLKATLGETYNYAGGAFSQASGGVGPTEIEIVNRQNSGDPVTAGIARTLKGAGPSKKMPLVAEQIPFNDRSQYSQRRSITVLAASKIKSGQIFPASMMPKTNSVFTGPLVVDFSGSPKQTIHYDSKTNVFAPGPLPT